MLSAILFGLLITAQAPSPSAPADLTGAIVNLGSFDLTTRTRAAQSIRRADPAVAGPALAAAAERHADEYVRFRAFVLLSGSDAGAAARVARAVLADRNDRLRMAAYQWFEHHPDASVLPNLLDALPRETSEFVRPALTRAIAAHGSDSRARAALVPLVIKGEDLFRGSVIAALGDYKAQYAVPEILAVAKLDGPLQDDAVTALGRIGDGSVRAELAALQVSAPREMQPSISAALCLLGFDCAARMAYLRETLKFAASTDGFQPLLRGTVHAVGVLAVSGRPDALALLLDAADGAPEAAREAISFGLAVVALRSPGTMLDALESRKDLTQTTGLLLEGFDILSEDFDEERFFADTRRAFWAAPPGSTRRAAAEALIQKLEF